MGNMWNERYSSSEYFYGTNANDFLIVSSGLISKNGHVLCLAEGEGRNAVFLASTGLKLSAVDFSEVGKEKTLKLAAEKKQIIDYTVADLNNYEMPKNLDAVVSIWCHLPLDLRKKVHHNTEEALKSGGLFILESYNPKQLEFKTGGPQNRELLYTDEEIRSDFKNIQWLLVQNTLREIKEGNGHLGGSSTLQMIGRKK